MKQHLDVLSQALDKANQRGAFTLQESAVIANSLGAIIQQFVPQDAKSNPIEEARAAEKAKREQEDSNTEPQDAPMEAVKE